MKEFFSVGDVISGYCNGYFGDDYYYYDRLCVMVTDNYAVFQYIEGPLKGDAVVLNEPSRLPKDLLSKWKVDKENSE
jgi:hypothetical protein